jgi:shikimate kinase
VESRHVVLVGAMGSGKTTIGRSVAAALDRPFVDNDEMLRRKVGVSAADLSERDGIDGLHRAEAAVALEALSDESPSVIAVAASTIESSEVRARLRDRAWVVWLRADPGVLAARFPSTTRPFGDRDPGGVVEEQSSLRDPLFAGVADASVETGRSDVEAVVAEVMAALRREPSGGLPS